MRTVFGAATMFGGPVLLAPRRAAADCACGTENLPVGSDR